MNFKNFLTYSSGVSGAAFRKATLVAALASLSQSLLGEYTGSDEVKKANEVIRHG